MPSFPDKSTRLDLPYILPAQAQKHVTHNEAIRRLDALVQLSVISMAQAATPGDPVPGARYILPTGATGDWASEPAGSLASYDNGAWEYSAPVVGWAAWVEDLDEMYVYDGSAWQPAIGISDYQNLPQVGVQTTADNVNRLAVSSEATLLTHDGAGHQLKLNKATAGDTASLMFQTNWSGRAEMGTTGTDDFEIKVSADGTVFQTAMIADGASGKVSFPQGIEGVAPAEFGTGPVATADYVASLAGNLVVNGTGLLGNAYNYPAGFTFDAAETPGLPGAVSFAGYYPGESAMTEMLPVDPNKVYRISSYVRQEGLAGDWSAFSNGERHLQYMGLLTFDVDRQQIFAQHHMRYRSGGVDSKTTLTSPLAPGDTVISVSDASGWNDTSSSTYDRGLLILGYRNQAGGHYSDYSRHVGFDLFDPANVDKVTGQITLSQGFPASLGNPDDPGGVWPAGTAIANTTLGSTHKYSLISGSTIPETDRWYHAQNFVGGIDHSGTNQPANFPPGTAFAKIFWLPNYSNAPGGFSGFPDTGSSHRVWFAGVSMKEEAMAMTQLDGSGVLQIKVPQGDFATGAVSLGTPGLMLDPVG